jgi:hypothetical protein
MVGANQVPSGGDRMNDDLKLRTPRSFLPARALFSLADVAAVLSGIVVAFGL